MNLATVRKFYYISIFVILVTYTTADQQNDTNSISNCTFPGQVDQVTSKLLYVNFTIPNRQYAGYLDSLNNTYLFYWFFESESEHPEHDPLVLWFNGGPGCSSLYGAFSEISPFRMQFNSTITVNPFAWTQKANIIFLESPVGAGFSYKTNTTDYVTNDEETVVGNFGALKSFFHKFPHFENSSFYLAGQSYAARYILQLSEKILERKYPPRFTGISIGNGDLGEKINQKYEPQFLQYHGFENVSNTPLPESKKVWVYNIKKDCFDTYLNGASYVYLTGGNSSKADIEIEQNKTDNEPEVVACGHELQLIYWLNKRIVRRAIHVKPKSVKEKFWDICTFPPKLNYTKTDEKFIYPLMKSIVERGVRTLIYSGDADLRCNFVATKMFVDSLGFKMISPDDQNLQYDGRDVGLIRRYEKNLTFVQVFDAGHMAPIDAPGATFKMFNDFLLGN